MGLALWLRPPGRTLAVFLCLMLVLGGALGWLGWQLLKQDRALEGQRVQERLELAADGRYISFMKGVEGDAKARYEGRRWQLWRVPAEGGEPQRLGLTVGRQIGGLRPLPDGRRLATTDFKANLEIWVMENFLPPAKTAK